MFTITVPEMAACLRVSNAAPKWWLTGCPRQRTGRAYSYRLADVIPRIRGRPRGLSTAEARSLVEVDRVKRSHDEDSLYLGEDAHERASRLIDGLTKVELERLTYCQSQFTAALVQTLLDRDLFVHLDMLRDVLALHPDVLAYTVAADAEALPDWISFAPAFAVINAPTTIYEAA